MSRTLLATIAVLLLIVVTGGLLWLAITSDNAVSALLSYAAGLSMIFLPCTLPLVFVIVPLAAKQDKPSKGLALALVFGLGLAMTIAVYGIVTAFLGDYIGLDQFTRVMFVVAGAMALIFALTELDLLRIPLPVFSHKIPNWITQGYGKSFLLGLFLGNAGIGCPNPAFYVILTYIASTGSATTGAWLGLLHGLGRATPLILLVVLALLGVQATRFVGDISKRLNTITGGALVVVGAFILTYGLFGMHWWEDSIFHAGWNALAFAIDPALAEDPNHPVAEGIFVGSAGMGWWSLVVLILVPTIWYKLKRGMRTSVFWVITLILLLLGLSASTGAIIAEHGHGVAPSDGGDHTHEEPAEPGHHE